MLHTVNKSPFRNSTLEECIRFTTKGSTILLIEDGVYAAKAGTVFESKLKDVMSSVTVCALGADLKARGIETLVDGVEIIDYAGFVDLVEANKVTAWTS